MTAALNDTAPASMLDRFTAIVDAFEDTSAGLTLDKVRRRVVVRHGDYTGPTVSVAATIGSRAAIGIVTSDRVLAQRCQPLVSASAARIARALAGANN